MSVYKTKKSPYYQYDFEIDGNRFFGSTKTTKKRDADLFERAERERAKQQLADTEAAQSSPRLDDIAGRYWLEIGQHHSAGDGRNNTWRQIERLLEFFGKDKLITEITDNDVAKLVAWRRQHRVVSSAKRKASECPLIKPATTNDTTEQLKKLFTRAKVWGFKFKDAPTWKNHWLKEPEERVRELQGNEGQRLDNETRDDYKPLFDFERATGIRQKELYTLRWSEVNWQEGQIIKRGKKDQWIVIPITPLIRSILWPLRGQHAEFVFTYVCERTMKNPQRIRGQRYPITKSGLNSHWKGVRRRAGVSDFRFHDFRHDVGTKMLRKTGNLKLVQKVLNHRDIESTMRYAHVSKDDVATAMHEWQSESRKKSRTPSATKSKRLKVIAD